MSGLSLDLSSRRSASTCAVYSCRKAPALRAHLAYCADEENTSVTCRARGHLMDDNHVVICDEHGLDVRTWECLVSISSLAPAPVVPSDGSGQR